MIIRSSFFFQNINFCSQCVKRNVMDRVMIFTKIFFITIICFFREQAYKVLQVHWYERNCIHCTVLWSTSVKDNAVTIHFVVLFWSSIYSDLEIIEIKYHIFRNQYHLSTFFSNKSLLYILPLWNSSVLQIWFFFFVWSETVPSAF